MISTRSVLFLVISWLWYTNAFFTPTKQRKVHYNQEKNDIQYLARQNRRRSIPKSEPPIGRSVNRKNTYEYGDEWGDDFYDDDDDDIFRNRRRNRRREVEDDLWRDEVKEIDWEWLDCMDEYDDNDVLTHVYVPPGDDDDDVKSVVLFVGGTWFGSKPLVYYPKLLEEIAKSSKSIIIACKIPISFTSTPLNHYMLAQEIQYQYTTTLQQLPCFSKKKDLPIIAMGHSLGAKLLSILSTKKSFQVVDASIYISFNNFPAISSIPGIQSLQKQKQKRLQKQKDKQYNNNYYDDDDMDDEDMYDDGYEEDPRNRYFDNDDDDDDGDEDYENFRRRNRRSRRSPYDDYEDEDEILDWGELFQEAWQDVSNSVTDTLKSRLQYRNSLEFYPTPDQLWHAISNNQSNVQDTLIVQFNMDTVDQSSKLASCLKSRNTPLYFARLSGYHITPVDGNKIPPILGSRGTYFWDEILRGRQPQSTKQQQKNQQNLQSTIITFLQHIQQQKQQNIVKEEETTTVTQDNNDTTNIDQSDDDKLEKEKASNETKKHEEAVNESKATTGTDKDE